MPAVLSPGLDAGGVGRAAGSSAARPDASASMRSLTCSCVAATGSTSDTTAATRDALPRAKPASNDGTRVSASGTSSTAAAAAYASHNVVCSSNSAVATVQRETPKAPLLHTAATHARMRGRAASSEAIMSSVESVPARSAGTFSRSPSVCLSSTTVSIESTASRTLSAGPRGPASIGRASSPRGRGEAPEGRCGSRLEAENARMVNGVSSNPAQNSVTAATEAGEPSTSTRGADVRRGPHLRSSIPCTSRSSGRPPRASYAARTRSAHLRGVSRWRPVTTTERSRAARTARGTNGSSWAVLPAPALATHHLPTTHANFATSRRRRVANPGEESLPPAMPGSVSRLPTVVGRNHVSASSVPATARTAPDP